MLRNQRDPVLEVVVAGIIGSLVEEGIEEVFPGLGELGFAGELIGAILGYGSSKEFEISIAWERFVK